MDFSEDILRRRLVKYKFRDLTIEELMKVHKMYPSFKPSMDTYTFSDGSQKDLLNLIGTIPVNYQGQIFNIPVRFWILDSYPFAPPICFLKPTSSMVIREGKHVDAQGRIYLHYLHSWKHPMSTIIGLIGDMIKIFETEPPLFSKPSKDGNNPDDLMKFLSKISGGVSDMNLQSQTKPGVQDSVEPASKVTVIGGGDLGMACVMAVKAKCPQVNLVCIDVSETSAVGGKTDLEIFNLPNVEVSKDYSSSAESSVVIITANSWSNDQSYVSVVQSNVDLFKGIIPSVTRYSPNSVLLIVSQPVDIMTSIAWKISGFPPNRVIGMGCNLDCERLQCTVAALLKTHSTETQVWIIGEHGENKVVAWQGLDGVTNNLPDVVTVRNKWTESVNRIFEALKGKGQRSWSVGLSVADLTDSLLRNRRKIHSVSTLAKGWFNITSDVFLSLPCILGTSGVTGVIQAMPAEETEVKKLQNSTVMLSELLEQLNI
ncbi:ubiquitin-conjugating enzyme E2 variant 3-like [Protopterus annectens]|uniref:ubiquitin-conjugating enzyme E2 variant 3-like n=1 Tax=Protopterus annectens TaxID=7888 RepID=UPI001CF95815|nr:ubiquitin-conjugating enzyme E2 variant 3-like [Protopterus annectens]